MRARAAQCCMRTLLYNGVGGRCGHDILGLPSGSIQNDSGCMCSMRAKDNDAEHNDSWQGACFVPVVRYLTSQGRGGSQREGHARRTEVMSRLAAIVVGSRARQSWAAGMTVTRPHLVKGALAVHPSSSTSGPPMCSTCETYPLQTRKVPFSTCSIIFDD